MEYYRDKLEPYTNNNKTYNYGVQSRKIINSIEFLITYASNIIILM